MPLRNEEYLREALDMLFYKDSIKFRLKAVKLERLAQMFPKKENEDAEGHLERLCKWLSKKFVGYSVHHVNGRFRISRLKTRAEAFDSCRKNTEPYLADETTAVVKFVIPCGKASDTRGALSDGLVTEASKKDVEEAKRIRWFFNTLFVNSILEVVNAEDEIWLLESGMYNQLHTWKAKE
jgi:hypothetical protein